MSKEDRDDDSSAAAVKSSLLVHNLLKSRSVKKS